MDTQIIMSEVYENAIDRLTKSELLADTMQDLLIKYEALLSSSIVNRYKSKSISKTLDKNSKNQNYEKYLLDQMNLSKRMYNKILKL
jgi:predicted ATPase with chaperone activity